MSGNKTLEADPLQGGASLDQTWLLSTTKEAPLSVKIKEIKMSRQNCHGSSGHLHPLNCGTCLVLYEGTCDGQHPDFPILNKQCALSTLTFFSLNQH